MKHLPILIIIGLLAGLQSANAVNFERDVLPVFEAKCFSCHSELKERPKGGVRLDSKEAILRGTKDGKIIVSGQATKSSLWTLAALPPHDEDAMPPPDKENPLTKDELARLETWITTGASFGNWTHFEHKAETEAADAVDQLPFDLRDARAAAAHIDALVGRDLEVKSLQPNPSISDEVFLRRIYLDLTGRIPSYTQAVAFIGSNDPEKRTHLIDALLASEGYVHHFLNYWADILRYRSKKDFLEYQRWIETALRENMPYDAFVYKLLSTEGITAEDGAAGYMHRDRDMPLDHTANTMQVFLGTQIGCAQCHDHPFDQWSQRDFYGMAAFLYGTKTTHPNPGVVAEQIREAYKLDPKKESDALVLESVSSLVGYSGRRAVHNYGIDTELVLPHDYPYDDGKPGDVIPPKVPFGSAPEIKQGEPPRTAFARWVTSPENPRFAPMIANRLWNKFMGRALVEPIDDFRDDNLPSNAPLLNFLAQAMVELDFDTKAFVRMICLTETYQRAATRHDVPRGQPYVFSGPVLRRMTAEQAWDSLLVLMMDNPAERENEKLDQFKAQCPDYVDMPLDQIYDLARETPGLQMGRRFRKYLKEKQPLAHLDQPQKDNQDAYRNIPSEYHASTRLETPAKGGHFLRQFGQSDRVSIEAANQDPTVPQVLTLLNGPMLDALLGAKEPEKKQKAKTVLQARLDQAANEQAQLDVLFLSLLARAPAGPEQQELLDDLSRHGIRDLAWVLLNSHEFLFIQ